MNKIKKWKMNEEKRRKEGEGEAEKRNKGR